MKFVLISRHTNGAEVPESEKQANLKAMGEWLALLKLEQALPIRGGTSVTANNVEEYKGDIGGVLVFEADNLEQAVALARQSPGLKYGFTHEVLPEISMDQASQSQVNAS
ncbi:MAG: YciI family protein [Steroidobacter sp.]